MLAFVSKFVLNIFPSVAASVIGAYIVHNYIYVKPAEPPPAVAASVASKADEAVVDRGPSIMPIPVSADIAEAETHAVARERAETDTIASASDKTASRDKHSAVHMRNAHVLARAASERLGIAHRRDNRSAETPAAQRERERVQASNLATPVVRSGPILMPAVDLVPDAQVGDAAVQPQVEATRAGPVRILPSASEMPLVKRLASFSNDVETRLVSQTLSTADDIVTAAKSAFQTVMPR
jgi:hypothetical protein